MFNGNIVTGSTQTGERRREKFAQIFSRKKSKVEKSFEKLAISNTIAHLYLDKSNRIAVTFPYNEQTIKKIKSIPGYKWHPELKHWSFPNDKEILEKILKVFDGKKIEIDPALIPKTNNSIAEEVTGELNKELRLRNYSRKTIKSYKSCIVSFLQYLHPRHPKDITSDEIRTYLLHLIDDKKFSAGTVNQVFNALRFYYVEMLKTTYKIGEIHRPKKEKKLPDILDEDEVIRIFQSVKNLKHRIMLMMTYASGLRASEVVNLRIEDVDVKRELIHIRGAKGKKDRYTPLSEALLKPLHIYWQASNLGKSGWLFPSGNKDDIHLSVRSIQAVFERAVHSAGIGKSVSMHTLRHTYATHLLEHGYDIRYIQKLLGHSSLKTTEIYTHVSKKDIAKIKSPLDYLPEDKLFTKNIKDVKLLKKQNYKQ